jgi:molybdate transport system substrate-binding protein
MNNRIIGWNAVITPLVFAVLISSGPLNAADETAPSLTILAAASTKDAITEIAKTFEKDAGIKVIISPGPSNALANQIINGAPADLFLSANQEWADKLKTEGMAADVRPLLSNGLVIVVPKGNPAKVASPKDLTSARVTRIALAGEKVPAGTYAQQALETLKLYQQLSTQRKIVRGQDVRATLNYVERGEVEAGIVYTTDARISDKVETAYTFDPKTYDKIVYPLVLTNRGKQNKAALKFHAYLVSDEAAAIFQKYGFLRLK